MNRAGAARVPGGGAEREHALAEAQPTVHAALQHRPPAGRTSPLPVHDADAPKAPPARVLDEVQDRPLRFGREEPVQIELILDRVVSAAEPADLDRKSVV